MKGKFFYASRLIFVVFMISIMGVLAACSSPAQTTPPVTTSVAPTTVPTTTVPPSTTAAPAQTVKVATKAGVGDYLTDAKGMALYYFTKDTIGNSTAVGPTLAAWPLFSPASFVLPPSLNMADFGSITRADGAKVATYKGWPLYYYAKDLASGDTLGEGVGGVWFLIKVPFYTVMLQTKADLGNYLVDAKGMTLYYFTKDSPGKSTAVGQTLVNWPLFNPASFVSVSTVPASDFGTITRDDGAKVATYKNWPLYYYIKDLVSGDTIGQGVGGVWYVVNPGLNFNPLATPSATATPAATTTSPAASTTPASTAPAVSITSPAAGATVPAGSVAISISVKNLTIVAPKTPNVATEGHIHYYLDVAIPTTPGAPAVTAPGTYKAVTDLSTTWPGLTAGTHTLGVQLVQNDHTPMVPPVTATVTITVGPAGTSSTTTTPATSTPAGLGY